MKGSSVGFDGKTLPCTRTCRVGMEVPFQRFDEALAQYYRDCSRVDSLAKNDIDTAGALNPIDRLLELGPGSDTFGLKWRHIASALSHELYDKISSSFMAIVNGNKRFETMNELLEEIKSITHIQQNEINYIQQLIERAKQFHANKDDVQFQETNTLRSTIHEHAHSIPDIMNPKDYQNITASLRGSVAEQFIPLCPARSHPIPTRSRLLSATFHSDISTYENIPNEHGYSMGAGVLSSSKSAEYQQVNTMSDIDSDGADSDRVMDSDQSIVNHLHDVYNVHKCFLFTNYHFKHYNVKEFTEDLQNCKHLQNCTDLTFKEDDFATLNLYPSYIIDDDMSNICKYFFCGSHIVQKESKWNTAFTLRICIIPRSVVCIYDERVIMPFDSDDIEFYLESIHIHPLKRTLHRSQDMIQITNALQNEIGAIDSNVLLIVDKTHLDNDVLYTCHNVSFSNFDELKHFYVIQMEFDVSYDHTRVVRCYLHYGNGRSRTRFYPEYFTTIIPRFFNRNPALHYTQIMDSLYEDSYKHGFAVDLTDRVLNKYYKMVTNVDHISVNYNRNIVKMKEKQDEKHKVMRNIKCTLEERLDVNQCTFIRYIIDCLKLYKENVEKTNAMNCAQFDLNRLSACYTHIICVHSFCLHAKQRKEIKTYVCNQVGICTNGPKCLCIKHHSRRRERNEK
eukprot:151758_1